jgi:two-component system phosphate regulon sensor histidine kinase PhoR
MVGGWKLPLAAMLGAGAMVLCAVCGMSAWVVGGVGLAGLGLTLAVGLTAAQGASRRVREEVARADELESRVTQLGRSLARAHATLDSMEEPVMTVGSDDLIAACNPAAEALLGVRADRLLRRPADEAFTQADLLGMYERARGGERVREQVRVARPEGLRVWDVSAVPLSSELGGPVLLCPRDVTDVALAMQVKTDFVANASHELRTPIAAMRVALDTLDALDQGDEEMRQRLVRVIASNVARLEEMVRDLLDLSRLETTEAGVERKPVALEELGAELARGLRAGLRIAPADIGLRFPARRGTPALGLEAPEPGPGQPDRQLGQVRV